MVKTKETFNGTINGKTVSQFLEIIDNDLSQEDRIKKLNEEMYDESGNLNEFFETLFSTNTDGKDWFNVVLKKSDFISDKNNVCCVLEKLANWILYAPDGERITKKTKYNFLTNEAMNKKSYKEMPISIFQDSCDEMIYDEVIDFILDSEQNYKMNAETKITALDIKEVKEISDYQKYINAIKTGGGNEIWSNKKANLVCSEVIKDQKIIKNHLYGTIVFKHVGKDSCAPEFDNFDFFEKEHINALIKCSDKDFQDNVTCLLYDMDCLAMRAGFIKIESEVYYHMRHGGKNISFVANHMNYTKQYISKIYNNVIKKIMRRYEVIYEDWYYLNICKGKYQTCSSCKKTKLLTNMHFHINSKKNVGFETKCKKCRAKVVD